MKINSNTKVVVWSQPSCPACDQAKNLLKMNNIPFEVKMIGKDVTKEEFFTKLPGVRSVPQIFADDAHIGGLRELEAAL